MGKGKEYEAARKSNQDRAEHLTLAILITLTMQFFVFASAKVFEVMALGHAAQYNLA